MTRSKNTQARSRGFSRVSSELFEAAAQAADWLPYHEPDHPAYEGAKSDAGRQLRDALQNYKKFYETLQETIDAQ